MRCALPSHFAGVILAPCCPGAYAAQHITVQKCCLQHSAGFCNILLSSSSWCHARAVPLTCTCRTTHNSSAMLPLVAALYTPCERQLYTCVQPFLGGFKGLPTQNGCETLLSTQVELEKRDHRNPGPLNNPLFAGVRQLGHRLRPTHSCYGPGCAHFCVRPSSIPRPASCGVFPGKGRKGVARLDQLGWKLGLSNGGAAARSIHIVSYLF